MTNHTPNNKPDGYTHPDLAMAAARAIDAQRDLEVAMTKAHKRGASLREIATATGYSHETVRKIVVYARQTGPLK